MEITSQEFKNHSFTVKSLVLYLKNKVENDENLTDIWISGDVNNLRDLNRATKNINSRCGGNGSPNCSTY